ncbi:MAG: glucose-6-phosphate isomerase [Patescibacteria group bacterium]
MALRYDFLNMMRNRVGAEGAAPEEVQALAGRLEIARRALKERKAGGTLGFFDVPKRRPSLEAMRAALRKLDKEIGTLVVVGIGGSLLGAQAVYAALDGLETATRGSRKLKLVFAGDSTDPRAVRDVIDGVDWKRAAVNVISKSGDTIEPMSVFVLLRERLVKAVGRKKAAERVIATTDAAKGTLREIAAREGYATLPVPEDVGGRFSVFTEVGAFPLLGAGINVDELWKGAAAEDASFWKTPPLKNVPMLFAGLQWLLYRRGKSVSVLMPYAKRLQLVGQWYRQLWAESLGKKSDRHRNRVYTGPTPVAAVGPADQHSQIQLYNEGPSDKIVTFIEIDDFGCDERLPEPWPDIEGVSYFAGRTLKEIAHIERQATAEALAENRRPNGVLQMPDLSGKSLGGLLQALMTATAIAGELWDVNAFDQPGVEAGKRNMYGLMGRKGY